MKLLRHLFVSISTLLIAVGAAAEISPTETPLRGARAELIATLKLKKELARSPRGSPITPVRLETQVRGIGRVRILFDHLTTRYWDAALGTGNDPLDVSLLKGRAVVRRGRSTRAVPVAGSVFRRRDVETLHIQLVATSRRGIARGLQLRGHLHGGAARVAAVPLSVLGGKACGASGGDLAHGHTFSAALPARPATRAGTLRELNLATVADPLWQSRYGSSSNAVVATLINAASTIYERDLGMTLGIAQQRGATISPPSDPTDSERWLDQFQMYAAANLSSSVFDAKFLFTTRTFSSDVIGIAYLGVVCSSPSDAVGLIKDVSESINYITFAHELGHSLNADHDPEPSSGCAPAVMCPFVTAAHTSFSTRSKNAITSYVAENGACLTSGEPGPDPTTQSLPTVRLTSSVSSSGRFSLRIILDGQAVAESLYRLSISDNRDFGAPLTRDLTFTPEGPGTYLFTTTIPRGVKARLIRGTNQRVRQRIYLRLSAERGGSSVVKTTSVDPTRVQKKSTSLRGWVNLLSRKLAAG